MNIITKMDLLGKEVLRRYPAINYGGCCVYAAMIVSALHKHKIKASGIVASYSANSLNAAGSSIDAVRSNITKNTQDEWNKNGVSFSHVGVEFEHKALIRTVKRHYDANGCHPVSSGLDGMTIYKGRLTLGELRVLAGTRKGWNNMFDRKDIPELRKLVNSYLAVGRKTVSSVT
jgi:hypothetical protein